MRVMWLGNIILPAIAEKENLPAVFVGGWMVGLSKHLSSMKNIDLVYIFDSQKKMAGEVDGYKYRGIPCNTNSSQKLGKEYVSQLITALHEFKPDVIHIWGTENQHSLAMVEAAEATGLLDRVVISIQGMVSVYAKHYGAYLPEHILHGKTLKDIVKGNLKRGEGLFREKGYLECEAIKKVGHVIGRTDWDKACTWEINPKVCYHYNNETLRDEFYSGSWEYEKCEVHSLFCSQAHYPIKGLHLMLNALQIVKGIYPDVKLYIGGKNYYEIPKYQRNAYEQYILNLIQNGGLKNNVFFIGKLNAEQMKKRYLDSNIFISPSSIENSPNSVGEAMLLGVPVIASRVGGVHNMLRDGEEGYLYPADEPYMLAFYIKEMFENAEHTKTMALKGKKHAELTHDPKKNLEDLLLIYKEIKGED